MQARVHLSNRDVTLSCFSRAPIGRLTAYKRRMGWQSPYVSTYNTDFAFDYGLVLTEVGLAVSEGARPLKFDTYPCRLQSTAGKELQNRGPRVRILPPLPNFSSLELSSAFLMAAIRTINLLYGWREASVTRMSGRPRGAGDAVLYGADGSRESAAMADVLSEMGVEFEYRSVTRDLAARREWEDLDGERLPMLRLGSMGIVRGLDRIRLQQLFGWVGC